jgi:hypothetical protein
VSDHWPTVTLAEANNFMKPKTVETAKRASGSLDPVVMRQLLQGIIGLRNPPYHLPGMNTEARLLHACLCAYRKHVSGNENLGWDELGDILHNAICEAIGDDGFVEWNEGEWDGE